MRMRLFSIRSVSLLFLVPSSASRSFFIYTIFGVYVCGESRHVHIDKNGKEKKISGEKVEKNATLPYSGIETRTPHLCGYRWIYERIVGSHIYSRIALNVGGCVERYARDILLLLRNVQWPMLCTYQKVNTLRSARIELSVCVLGIHKLRYARTAAAKTWGWTKLRLPFSVLVCFFSSYIEQNGDIKNGTICNYIYSVKVYILLCLYWFFVCFCSFFPSVLRKRFVKLVRQMRKKTKQTMFRPPTFHWIFDKIECEAKRVRLASCAPINGNKWRCERLRRRKQ